MKRRYFGGGRGNNAPTFISTAPTSAVEGQAYSYQAAGSDPNGDALTWTLPTKPTGMTVSATGLVQWAPTTWRRRRRAAVEAGSRTTIRQSWSTSSTTWRPPTTSTASASTPGVFSAGGHYAHALCLNNSQYFAACGVSAGVLAALAGTGAPAAAPRKIPCDIHIGTTDTTLLPYAQTFLNAGWSLGSTLYYTKFSGGHTYTTTHLSQIWNNIKAHIRP